MPISSASEDAKLEPMAASETQTIPPSKTPIYTTTPTETFTPTVTPTPTNTPSSTPTSTHTPTHTPLPTETSTPTLPPPTSAPVLPSSTPQPVTIYPRTPTFDWDEGAFRNAVQVLNSTIPVFYEYFGGVVTGNSGSCGRFWSDYDKWEHSPIFTSVPTNWLSAYNEYVSILQTIKLATDPITQVCVDGGGTIDDETDQAILAAFESLKLRIVSLVSVIG